MLHAPGCESPAWGRLTAVRSSTGRASGGTDVPDGAFRHSEKFKAARDALPAELRGAYDEFVADYVFFTMRRFGRGYVAYEVLADLVRAGWRPPPRLEGDAGRGPGV